MKSYKKNILLIPGMLLWLLISCTSGFESLNENDYTASTAQLKQDFNHLGALIEPMQLNVYMFVPVWKFQLQQNLIGDIFSGYMMIPAVFRGNSNNTNYDLVNGWNKYPWDIAYSFIMANAYRLKLRAKEKKEYAVFHAISLIIKVEAMHRVSDIYGPVIYSKFGTSETATPFDSQKDVYNQFFKDLDLAVETLTKLAQSKEKSKLLSFDASSYKGNYTKWVRFANSLRLRLAMRIVKADPSKAKEEAEKAVNHPIGVIEDNSDNIKIISKGFLNPLVTINSSWNDIRMGAPMESILKGYKDPRLNLYFETSEVSPGNYVGIRNGIEIKDKTDYQGFSKLGKVINTNEVQWMCAAEVFFLRAEGALRDWNMGAGTAQSFYEKGIQTSFEQYGFGIKVVSYLADNTSVASPYKDPKNPKNNVDSGSPYLSAVTIAWDAGASDEVKLEKIITQKWLAMFPDGQEAWSEFRRTGYPKLFPVVINKSGGKIKTEDFVRRINFPQTEKDANAAEVAKAVELLKGPDTGGTRLWWDIEKGNF